eukprot:TRINITY_DN74197_c0_g1_i1.p1 TRINITY_DN74197_c0_g1~~TRINITY_DN74197_c0_g1_i1.p1  ORF type:complete len:327 (-),score=66.11 TRINITY_DN74197_c0_g1_i1:150-1130(-)
MIVLQERLAQGLSLMFGQCTSNEATELEKQHELRAGSAPVKAPQSMVVVPALRHGTVAGSAAGGGHDDPDVLQQSYRESAPACLGVPCGNYVNAFGSAAKAPTLQSRRQCSCGMDGERDQADNEMVLERAFRSFTESMQHGVELEVVLDDGSFMDVTLTLDRNFSRLLLRLREVQREILLDDIAQVGLGTTEEENKLADKSGALKAATAASEAVAARQRAKRQQQIWENEEPPTMQEEQNNCTTTLLISSAQFLTFVFETDRLREYFETCLRVLLASRRNGLPLASPALTGARSPSAQLHQAARLGRKFPHVSRPSASPKDITSTL